MHVSVGLGTNGMWSSRFEHMRIPTEVATCELAGRSVNMCIDVLIRFWPDLRVHMDVCLCGLSFCANSDPYRGPVHSSVWVRH